MGRKKISLDAKLNDVIKQFTVFTKIGRELACKSCAVTLRFTEEHLRARAMDHLKSAQHQKSIKENSGQQRIDCMMQEHDAEPMGERHLFGDR